MIRINIRALIISVGIICIASIAIILFTTNTNKTDGSTIIIPEGQVALGAESTAPSTIELLCDGNGTIEVTPYKKGYTQGEPIEFTPHPREGWTFDHWEGDIPNEFYSDNTVKIKIPEGVYRVVAVFTQK